MAEPVETTLTQVERLIAEVLEVIPDYTRARGNFSTMPGYTARYPDEWIREFHDLLQERQERRFSALGPDSDEIFALVVLVADMSELARAAPFLVNTETLLSVLGYVVLEILLRRLSPGLDAWGCLIKPVPGLKLNQRVSGLKRVLSVFEHTTLATDLKDNLEELNSKMVSEELGRSGSVETVDLYERLQRGRDRMLHGNLTHSFEGNLLVLLIGLIILHVMNAELSGAAIEPC